MGYLPAAPPPQQRHSSRNPILLGCGISAVAAFLLLGSCGVGMAIGSDPAASGKPAATQTVTAQATVTVTVSANPITRAPSSPAVAVPAKVTLPNVIGKNGAIAEETLREKGVTNIQWASADPSARVVLLTSNWKVTKEPKPGTKVAPSQVVVLTGVKAS